MSLLAGLNDTNEEILGAGDFIPSGRVVLDSGVYQGKIKLAYIETTTAGSQALVLEIETENGAKLNQKLWFRSGKAKGNLNYYVRDNKKHYLPGFVLANDLCILVTGKGLGEQEYEDKVIPLYSFADKKEVPTKVPMLVNLIGEEVAVGVIKEKTNRNVRVNDEYVPSDQIVEGNEIDKFFRAKDLFTVSETKAPEEVINPWVNLWKGKWEGEVRDRTEKDPSKVVSYDAVKGNAPSAPAVPSPGGMPAPTTTLFPDME